MAKGFDEAAWRASNDARTLAEANAIMNDSGRLKKAQAAAKKEYESTMKSAGAMKDVFNSGSKTSTRKKK